MPLYEYKCQACGDVFEVIQKFVDQPLTVHEKCGGSVERLISTSALQFKGTGWYVTDYGKGNSKEPKPKPASSNGGDKSASSAPADTSSKTESSSTSTTTTSKPDSK
jgi:putative FmdB family regulatory protein